MIYTVDGWQNFCRVFEMPEFYPSGFCHGGGKPVNFQMVDWFNPVQGLGSPTISKESWEEKFGEGEYETVIINGDDLSKDLTEFLAKKVYIKEGRSYLVVCDFGLAFTFEGSL